MFWLECISPIAKGDLKWRDALLVAHRVNSNAFEWIFKSAMALFVAIQSSEW